MLITSLALLCAMYPPKTTAVYYTCQMKFSGQIFLQRRAFFFI